MSDLERCNVFRLAQEPGRFPVKVPHAPATGQALFCSNGFSAEFLRDALDIQEGHLGVDVLRLGPGDSFPLHSHPGHHLLLILAGKGTVTYGGEVLPTEPGDLYLINAEIAHAVGGVEEHTLLAFGAPHVHLDDPARMRVLG